MTLRNQIMIWVLRAAALWGATELGLTIYDEVQRELASWSAIEGHGATMQRLTQRDREIARALAPIEHELTDRRDSEPTLHLTAQLTPEAAIASALKKDLSDLGAQGVQATVNASPVGQSTRAVIDLSWNEPLASTPGVAEALAKKRPYLVIVQLTYSRIEGSQMAKGEARVQVDLKVAKGPTS